jgi:hypothetical protein
MISTLKHYCVVFVILNLICIQTNLKIHLINNKFWQCQDAMQNLSGLFCSRITEPVYRDEPEDLTQENG